jgi:hypothetical protein
MSKNIDLRKEYVKLVQQEGKDASLFKLKEIWELNKDRHKTHECNPECVTPIKPVEIIMEKKYKTIKDLDNIKGIGPSKFADIKSMYSDIDTLIIDLKNGKNLPLSNDIEKILKKELLI